MPFEKASASSRATGARRRDLRNTYHRPESKKRKSSEQSPGSHHPHSRYGNAGKTSVFDREQLVQAWGRGELGARSRYNLSN